MTGLKLNLGCGDTRLAGYVNVDKYDTFAPDLVADLEAVPWPWPDDSVAEVQLIHVLEHLGQSTDVFLGVMKELYRVCRHGARIHVRVPHPHSAGFLGDPTHVRPITPDVLSLFSLEANRLFMARRWPNTRLAMYLGVDFRTLSVSYTLTPRWQQKVASGQIGHEELAEAAETHNNVIDEIALELEAVKDGA